MNIENNSTLTTDDISPKPRRNRRGRGMSKGPVGRRGLQKQGRSTRGKSKGDRRKRPLAHGDLRLLILSIIKTNPSHGYGLIAEIKTRTSGFYEPSPGVIYPALEALQDLGWVEIVPEKGKRVLHITESGQVELTQQSETINSINQRLSKLASPDQNIETDDIRGALRLLKHTTISNFKGRSIDIETRKQAVIILEDARKKIAELT